MAEFSGSFPPVSSGFNIKENGLNRVERPVSRSMVIFRRSLERRGFAVLANNRPWWRYESSLVGTWNVLSVAVLKFVSTEPARPLTTPDERENEGGERGLKVGSIASIIRAEWRLPRYDRAIPRKWIFTTLLINSVLACYALGRRFASIIRRPFNWRCPRKLTVSALLFCNFWCRRMWYSYTGWTNKKYHLK